MVLVVVVCLFLAFLLSRHNRSHISGNRAIKTLQKVDGTKHYFDFVSSTLVFIAEGMRGNSV